MAQLRSVKNEARLILLLIFTICIELQYAAELKKYDVFTAADKTKWISITQLEQIFSSISETLYEMNEKQKRDSSLITQLSSNIQSMSIRLQSVEEQLTRIETTESYNKAQLQQYTQSAIKEELQIDQIVHRIEKNQQQMNQRLNDVDSNLEAISKKQEVMEKGIRKINVVQSTLTDNVDELSEHTKQQSTKILQNITSTQHEFHKKLKDSIAQSSNQEDVVRIVPSLDTAKYSTNQSKLNQNDDTQQELIISVDNKLHEIKTTVQSIETNLHGNTEIINKIYNKIDRKNEEFETFFKDQFNFLSERVNQQNIRELNELDGKFQKNLELIIKEQINFKNTCYRLQLNEEQIEDKAVQILEKLFTYIDNRTYEIQRELENLLIRNEKHMQNQTQQLRELKMLLGHEGEFQKVVHNLSNLTQNDAATAKPYSLMLKPTASKNFMFSMPPMRKWTTQPEIMLREKPENWMADQPQQSTTEKQTGLLISTVQKPEDMSLTALPDRFFGIEGLSRDTESLRLPNNL